MEIRGDLCTRVATFEHAVWTSRWWDVGVVCGRPPCRESAVANSQRVDFFSTRGLRRSIRNETLRDGRRGAVLAGVVSRKSSRKSVLPRFSMPGKHRSRGVSVYSHWWARFTDNLLDGGLLADSVPVERFVGSSFRWSAGKRPGLGRWKRVMSRPLTTCSVFPQTRWRPPCIQAWSGLASRVRQRTARPRPERRRDARPGGHADGLGSSVFPSCFEADRSWLESRGGSRSHSFSDGTRKDGGRRDGACHASEGSKNAWRVKRNPGKFPP